MLIERPHSTDSIVELIRSIKWPDIKFLPSYFEIDQWIECMWPGFRRVKFRYQDAVMLVPPDVVFEEDPQPHDEFSDQIYWVKGYRADGNVFMVGELKAGGRTSEHDHPPGMTEVYRIIAGEYHLKLGEGELERAIVLEGNLWQGDIGVVPPETLHHGEAPNGPAVVFLCMVGAAYLPEEQWHRNRRR